MGVRAPVDRSRPHVYWERDRFVLGAVQDHLRHAFPPALPQIQHVVINGPQGEEFRRRTGLSYRIVPNVMDFAISPEPSEDDARRFKPSDSPRTR